MFEPWKLTDYAPREGVALGAWADQHAVAGWIDVPVPGDLHHALVAAGRIPDPFYDRNELECAWIEEREWWYRTRFTVENGLPQPGERLLLIFHGLDTFATVWLNGGLLGKHGNMFREAVFDITQMVRIDRPNTLAICFEPPMVHVKDKPALSWPSRPDQTKRNLMRKAQFGFGWDWAPRLPTVGIWRPVELRRQRQAVLQGAHFVTLDISPAGEQALVTVKVEVERFAGERPLEVDLTLIPPDGTDPVAGQQLTLTEIGSHLVATIHLTVAQPHLWWTHDLGEPAMYTLWIRLLEDGCEIDGIQLPVGIRTLKLDQSPDPDEPGTRFFRFILNGVPIFARGANWTPASSFVGDLTAERYEQLLTTARDANMNMLRIWGGGIYEHDAFYDLCDRLGLLVWQDFMFACAPYPEDDPAFVNEIQAEVRYQVRRLRNHPCLALWCGNNENQWLHEMRAPRHERQTPVPGSLYYDEILPQAVQELDGATPYWPGSPYGGPQPNSMVEGDVHDWHVWHGQPVGDTPGADLSRLLSSGPTPEDVAFTHYAKDMGRFISEFGMHASPVYETLRRCIPPRQLYHHSRSMDHHNKDIPKTKGDNLMLTVTGLPRGLEEYIDFSMIAQAEGLKFGIEHFRRRKPHCSGTLFWQLNDCWPVLSWSVLDYYGFGKAGYYYARRAYAPVLASFKATAGGQVELWITNDTLSEVSDTIVIQSGTFAAGVIWTEKHQVQVPANASQVVWRGEPPHVIPRADHYLLVRSPFGRFPPNRHFFAAIKDLLRPAVEPEISISANDEHKLSVQVFAPRYLYYFHVTVPHEHTHFTDNYFDLASGEGHTVIITNHSIQLTPGMISCAWR